MHTDFSNYIGVAVGTGPSLTEQQINYIKQKRSEDKCRVFAGNNAAFVIQPDVLISCNIEWYEHYWNNSQLQALVGKVDMWHWDEKTCKKFNLNHIKGEWGDGLSTKLGTIHYGHSTGFQLLGMMWQYGIRKMVLVGYDMRFPKEYNGRKKEPGGLRHSKLILPTGEYPAPLQHWTQSPNSIDKDGRLIGLIRLYEKIRCDILEIEIINCSPNSALTCFPNKRIEEVL